MNSIGQTLRLLRMFHDMTATEVAGHLGITKGHLSEIENGRKAVTIERLAGYGKLFKIRLSEIVALAEGIERMEIPPYGEITREHAIGKPFQEKFLDFVKRGRVIRFMKEQRDKA